MTNPSAPIVAIQHRTNVLEAEAEVSADRWHHCACFDGEPPSAADCSNLAHAAVRARATEARLAVLADAVALIRAGLPTVRPGDVEALSRALLAPIGSRPTHE